ncbi:MAG: long-chain fatty acid--CoA ligase [Alphaproteobacteria bacterium]|nr:long-chain fatty acid--CoA ligase [Alphaproteobacteria bacterium]
MATLAKGTAPYPDWPNLATMMFDRARQWANDPMLRSFRDEEWKGITWGQFAIQAASAARRLRAAGVSAGDRVMIVSENRPEYPILEIALMAIRAVPVPTYTTNTVDDHRHILGDCGARVAVVSTAALALKVAAAGPLDLLISMERFEATGVKTALWEDFTGDTRDFADIATEAAEIPGTSLACMIYTSGTGGSPKGVMLPHRAILSNCRGAYLLILQLNLKRETYLSFLPLSHSYEHTAGQFLFLSIGTEIVYSRGVEHLAADMLAIRPTLLTMVPRVLEVIRSRILSQVVRQSSIKQRLFNMALAIGTKKVDRQRLTLSERILDPILDRLVRAKVRERFGGRLIAAVSGGARLEPEVGRFFLAMGILIIQGYGQTEAGPIISANPPNDCRVETVGTPLEGVDLKIADDGEILVRGDLVMHGYWGRPDETEQAIRDGWLHTGDIGTLDADNYLRITDRKKDMIVLSGGENVSPARIEGMLIAEPAIAQAVVFGEGRSGLTALVVTAEGFDASDVSSAVSDVSKRLSVTERIRRHAVVPPFTIENGLMTATQKIRRHLVREAHAEVLEKLGS